VLQADLDDTIGFLSSSKALVGFVNRPGHRFFCVEMLSRGERVQEMLRMEVQWSGDYYGVDIFTIQQETVVRERVDLWRKSCGFLATPGVDVRDGDKLRIRKREDLPQKILASGASAYRAHTQPIVRAKHA
jgi:hypothetical protein